MANESRSCLRCKYLFTWDTGYSNYTMEDTDAHCVLCRNPKLADGTPLPDEVRKYQPMSAADSTRIWGYRWMEPENDTWYATQDGRCELYVRNESEPHHIDCEGDDIVTPEEGRRIMLETADAMPLLIALYFGGCDG